MPFCPYQNGAKQSIRFVPDETLFCVSMAIINVFFFLNFSSLAVSCLFPCSTQPGNAISLFPRSGNTVFCFCGALALMLTVPLCDISVSSNRKIGSRAQYGWRLRLSVSLFGLSTFLVAKNVQCTVAQTIL